MLKLIYLARRKPGLTFDEFVRRWRRHGALAMAQPLWRFSLAYVQAEPIRPAPVPLASQEYDAVACYMVRDDMFSSMDEDDLPGALAMAEDELETFSAPIPGVSLWVDEEHIRAGELGGITAFLFFRSVAAARAAAGRGSQGRDIHRITLNLRNNALAGPGGNTLPFEAVLELAASSLPGLAGVLGSGEGSLLHACDVAMVTREAVLWNRLSV